MVENKETVGDAFRLELARECDRLRAEIERLLAALDRALSVLDECAPIFALRLRRELEMMDKSSRDEY